MKRKSIGKTSAKSTDSATKRRSLNGGKSAGIEMLDQNELEALRNSSVATTNEDADEIEDDVRTML
jgi:hypothetical protein